MIKHQSSRAVTYRTPQEIMEEIAALDADSAAVLDLKPVRPPPKIT